MVSEKASLSSARSMTYPQTLDMLIEKPFTGYGYGRFEAEYVIYTARQHQLNPAYPPGLPGLDHPHNELLLWAVEGGVIPLLGILLAALFALVKLQASRKGTRLAIFGLFAPIVLHSQLEYPFYHSAAHWIIFVILLYWLDQRSTRYRCYNFSVITRVNLRLGSLLLPAITALFMLSGLHSNYILTKFERSSRIDPTILEQVSNPAMWQDRYEWNIYSSYLKLGLASRNPLLIQPYIDWSQSIIRNKPREAFYKNLILAYLGTGEESKAEQIRAEAQFLFPRTDFSLVKLNVVPAEEALSPTLSGSVSTESKAE
jgi:O-antigen polymerase